MRKFESGATRDTDTNKYDYEAFLSPRVLESFAAYMHKNRFQANGTLRDGDNWQKGIPIDAYMKSMFRHFMDVWKAHRGLPAPPLEESLNALHFNVMGMQHEHLKKRATKGAIPIPHVEDSPVVEQGDFDPRHLQNGWDKAFIREDVYTHRYGELAHDEEAIQAESETSKEERFHSIRVGEHIITDAHCSNFGCCSSCQKEPDPAIGAVAGMERGKVLGISTEWTQEDVPPLAPEVQSAVGREKAP